MVAKIPLPFGKDIQGIQITQGFGGEGTSSHLGPGLDSSVTFDGSQITIAYPASEEGSKTGSGPFNGFEFETGINGPVIKGVSLKTNIPGLTSSNLTYSAHKIDLNEAGLTFPATTPANIQLSVTFAEPTAAQATGGGSAQINPETSSSQTSMSFIPEQNSGHTTSAHRSGETLVGSAQYDDIFQGRAADLNGDLINLFGRNDVIDITDLTFGHVALSYNGTDTAGTLSVTDGLHSAAIRLSGDLNHANFHLASDMHGGTNVTYA